MFGHLPELVIILVIGLLVFGPQKLPEVAGTVGKTVRELREAVDSVMHPVEPEQDFSTYYYESLARAGEPVPSEPEVETSLGEFPDEESVPAEPIAFPGSDKPVAPVEAPGAEETTVKPE